MSKKFCIFAAQYFPHLGGVENYSYHMASQLIQEGNSVVLVTSNVGGLPVHEVQEGIEIYRVPCFALLNGRYPFLKMNREFRKIDRVLLRKKFDLVIVNTRFYPHSVYGALLAKKKNVRCIFIEHGTGHMTVHNPIGDFVENVVEHGLTFIDKKLCKEYYGVSKDCLEWLKHFHIQGSGTLYNAVDLEKIQYQMKNPVCSFREKYQIPQSGVIVTFTGRLLKEKGILKLAQAVKNINKTEKNLYLLAAGDGDEEESLEKYRSEQIIPLGRLKFQEVIALLKESDIFCLPSDSEGFATSILEAVACKNYIITTGKGGAKELLIDSSYGTILENNEIPTIEKALREVMEKPKKRSEAIEKTYQYLVAHFTWEITANKVLGLLENKR